MSSLCPVIAYDEDSKIFYNDDNTIAFGFLCQPLPGITDSLEAQVRSLLTTDLSSGTTLSVMLFRSPDIDELLDGMLSLRVKHIHKLLTPIVVDRTNFLRYHTRNALTANVKGGIYDSGIIVDVKLIITVKIPALGMSVFSYSRPAEKAKDNKTAKTHQKKTSVKRNLKKELEEKFETEEK